MKKFLDLEGVKYIINKVIGKTDISGIGDGTLKGAISSIKSLVGEKSSELSQEIDVERKRINNFTKLGEGSTTGDAELADMRVGADGKEYDTAGEAVRGQVGELKEVVENGLKNFTVSENLWDEKWEQGLYKIETGEKTESSGYIRSRNLIDVEPNHNYCIFLGNEIEAYLIWFDENKRYISYKATKETSGALSPSNAKYVGINLEKAKYHNNVSFTYKQIYSYVPYKLKVNATEIVNVDKTEWGKQAKSFSIIGDSYSTFQDWNPASNEVYYPTYSKTVNFAKETWWYLLSKNLGWELLINDSYSGATVCTHVREAHTQDVAFVNRVKNSMGEHRTSKPKPNIIFIFGGQNDKQVQVEIGQPKYSDWTTDDLYKFAPAFCYLIDYLTTWNPQARIINITNSGLDTDITESMNTICEHYGIDNIVLQNIEKDNMHPTKDGMLSIYQEISDYLKENKKDY